MSLIPQVEQSVCVFALGAAGLGLSFLTVAVCPPLPVWTWEEDVCVYKDGVVRVSPHTSCVCIYLCPHSPLLTLPCPLSVSP